MLCHGRMPGTKYGIGVNSQYHFPPFTLWHNIQKNNPEKQEIIVLMLLYLLFIAL